MPGLTFQDIRDVPWDKLWEAVRANQEADDDTPKRGNDQFFLNNVRLAQHFRLDYFQAYDRLTMNEWSVLRKEYKREEQAAKLAKAKAEQAANARKGRR